MFITDAIGRFYCSVMSCPQPEPLPLTWSEVLQQTAASFFSGAEEPQGTPSLSERMVDWVTENAPIITVALAALASSAAFLLSRNPNPRQQPRDPALAAVPLVLATALTPKAPVPPPLPPVHLVDTREPCAYLEKEELVERSFLRKEASSPLPNLEPLSHPEEEPIPDWFIGGSRLLNELQSGPDNTLAALAPDSDEELESDRGASGTRKLGEVTIPPELLKRINRALPIIKGAALDAIAHGNFATLFQEDVVRAANYFGFDLFGEVLVRMSDPMPLVQYYLDQRTALIRSWRESNPEETATPPILGVEGQITADHLGDVLVKVGYNVEHLKAFQEAFSTHHQFKNIPGEKVFEALLNACDSTPTFQMLCTLFEKYFTPLHLSQSLFEQIIDSITDPESLVALLRVIQRRVVRLPTASMGALPASLPTDLPTSDDDFFGITHSNFVKIVQGAAENPVVREARTFLPISRGCFLKMAQMAAKDRTTFDYFIFLLEELNIHHAIPASTYFLALPSVASNEDSLRSWYNSFLKNNKTRDIPPETFANAFIATCSSKDVLELFKVLFEKRIESHAFTVEDIGKALIASTSDLAAMKAVIELFKQDLRDIPIENQGEALVRASASPELLGHILNDNIRGYFQFHVIPSDQYASSLIEACGQIETLNLWFNNLNTLPQFAGLTEDELGAAFVRSASDQSTLAQFLTRFSNHPHFNTAPFLGEALANSASNHESFSLLIQNLQPDWAAIPEANIREIFINCAQNHKGMRILEQAFRAPLQLPEIRLEDHLRFLQKLGHTQSISIWQRLFGIPNLGSLPADVLREIMPSTLGHIILSLRSHPEPLFRFIELMRGNSHLREMSAETLQNSIFHLRSEPKPLFRFIELMRDNSHLQKVLANLIDWIIRDLRHVPVQLTRFIELMRGNPHLREISVATLENTIRGLRSEPEQLVHFIEVMRENPHLREIPAEQLRPIIRSLGSYPEQLARFIEIMRGNSNPLKMPIVTLWSAIWELKSHPEQLFRFIEVMRESPQLREVTAEQLEDIIWCLASQPEQAVRFTEVMRENPQLREVSAKGLENIIWCLTSHPDQLVRFIELMRDNPHLLEVSAKKLGNIIWCLRSHPDQLFYFIEAMRGSPHLQRVTADDLGKVMSCLAGEDQVDPLFRFMEAMRENPHLLEISVKKLERIIWFLRSQPEQLVRFIERMRDNPHLLEISEVTLEITMDVLKEGGHLKALSEFRRAMANNPNLPRNNQCLVL